MDGLPLGDGEPGIGEPGRTADDDHCEDQQAHDIQPPPYECPVSPLAINESRRVENALPCTV
jgi:hypothetical protein